MRDESLAKLDIHLVKDIHFIDCLELQLGSLGYLGCSITRFCIGFGIINGSLDFALMSLTSSRSRCSIVRGVVGPYKVGHSTS